jgi:hypothetical protein
MLIKKQTQRFILKDDKLSPLGISRQTESRDDIENERNRVDAALKAAIDERRRPLPLPTPVEGEVKRESGVVASLRERLFPKSDSEPPSRA